MCQLCCSLIEEEGAGGLLPHKHAVVLEHRSTQLQCFSHHNIRCGWHAAYVIGCKRFADKKVGHAAVQNMRALTGLKSSRVNSMKNLQQGLGPIALI